MASKITQVHLIRRRGLMRVVGYGQTGRQQKFVRTVVMLDPLAVSRQDFHSELGKAVEKIYTESEA